MQPFGFVHAERNVFLFYRDSFYVLRQREAIRGGVHCVVVYEHNKFSVARSHVGNIVVKFKRYGACRISAAVHRLEILFLHKPRYAVEQYGAHGLRVMVVVHVNVRVIRRLFGVVVVFRIIAHVGNFGRFEVGRKSKFVTVFKVGVGAVAFVFKTRV